jgi:hypothetical protein
LRFVVADVDKVLIALEELLQRSIPAFFSHINLAATLFDNSKHARIFNNRAKLFRRLEDFFHPSLFFGFDAHLNFERKDFKQHISLAHIVLIHVVEVYYRRIA